MNTVCKMDMCAGCMLCENICPKNAIKVIDSLDAYNAIIDEDLCIKCNKCNNICPQNKTRNMYSPIACFDGWADEEIRKSSSSGGFAAAIEKAFIRNGGVVYSCYFSDGIFSFGCASSEREVDKFVGSKYIKSFPGGIYKEILSKINNKEKVLFVGLPCQVAACENFIGESEYLYTIDLICHGTPSPKVLDLFLKDYGIKTNELESITFRKKNQFELDSKISFSVPGICDYYSMTFLDGTSYTASCYGCKYARLERVSDITLGDSWGTLQPLGEQEKGISLALVQTEKGLNLIQNSNVKLFRADLNRAVEANKQLKTPSKQTSHRALFFKELKKGMKFKSVIQHCYPSRYIKDKVKTILYHLHLWGGVNDNSILYLIEIRLRAKE